MIKENQIMLNRFNVLTDGASAFFTLLIAFWIRFYIFEGDISVPFVHYAYLGAALVPVQLFTFTALGLYESFRKKRLYQELGRLFSALVLDMSILLMFLFLFRGIDFSRATLAIYFVLNLGLLGGKRIALRFALRHYRQKGYNQKHVLIVGTGKLAAQYLETILRDREFGYCPMGYVAEHGSLPNLKKLGRYGDLSAILEHIRPDEVISAIPPEDYSSTPVIITACEKAGVKLSIIPFYAEYMSSNPQFDDLDGLPLLNIRRIPLDNWANAFSKRAMDVALSLGLIVLTSPVMLAAVIGVRLSSPGPVIFRQERVGKHKRPFKMYKFRSMRVNDKQDTGWSGGSDPRKTPFGALIRKLSIDELPQFFNVLKGDMSLVGPRPEVPFYVEQFKEDIPLYMVKHQVRPGITGWAQVNGLRGDTSIRARIEHDIYYIEHWSIMFDIKILFMTLFKGVVNSEKLDE